MPNLRAVLEAKGTETVSIPSSATVLEAVRQLSRKGVGSVLVIDEGSLVGILTERDAVRRVLARNLDPKHTLVANVMTREVLTGLPEESVLEARRRMGERHVRHLVVCTGGSVVGAISIGDLAKGAARDLDRSIDALTKFISGPSVKHDSDWPTAFPPPSDYAEDLPKEG